MNAVIAVVYRKAVTELIRHLVVVLADIIDKIFQIAEVQQIVKEYENSNQIPLVNPPALPGVRDVHRTNDGFKFSLYIELEFLQKHKNH